MASSIKNLAKCFLRLPKAFSAFGRVITTGGVRRVEICQIEESACLSGKRIVVTGGGSGIGLAIAKKCAASGASVLITGRNEDKLQHAIAQCGSSAMQYLVWDVSDTARADTMVERCNEILGGVADGVVNNAGVQPKEFFPAVTAEEWERIYRTNSKGTFFVAQAFCCKWMSKRSDTLRYLINISSQGGLVGATYPYRMSKWDVRGLTEGLGVQMAPYGVLVNGIAPGVIKTAMQEFALAQGDNDYCDQNLLGRVALPEEVAELAVFMMSGACNFMVGQTIALDGGYSLR